jgi:hypothetical protein
MMVSQGNLKGAWTLKINCNKQCWTNDILLKKKMSIYYDVTNIDIVLRILPYKNWLSVMLKTTWKCLKFLS